MKNERRETEGSEYVPAEISGLLNGMEEEPIYVMTVELEEGKSQAIKIYADSTPNELAFEFCKKNNLNITAMNYLTEQIKVLLDQLYNKLELVKRNTGLISEDEHQCIQEVDEENYQTEARKSGGNSLTPNSRFNYIEGTNENDSEKCNRKINKLKRQNEKIYNTKTEIKSDNIKPSVASEIKQKSFNEERTENKRDLTKNSNEEEKTNERFFNNKAISYELKTDKNSNIINPFNKYKELESPKRDSTNKKLIHDKNKIPKPIEKDSQKLFSYQIFYENFKKQNLAKLDKHERDNKKDSNNLNYLREKEIGGHRLDNSNSSNLSNKNILKNSNINNSNISSNSSSKKNKQVTNSESIFEKLHRNSHSKRMGSNVHGDYESNKKEATTASAIISNNNRTFNSSQLGIRDSNSLLNNSSSAISSMNRSSNYQYKNEEAINFGERLYHKGIKLKEETEKKLEHYRREKENFDSEKYTHKPDVNELSIDQLKRRNENNMVYNKDEYILNYQQYLKDKLNKLREKHDKKEKFTFSPEINIRSTKMEEEKMNTKLKSSSLSPERRKRPDELYELSKIKELKLNQLSNQYYSSFNYKPEINQYQSSDKNTVLNLPFNERSELYRKKSEERKKLMQQEINSPIDRKTGQNLFVPKLMAKSRERINERMGSTASRHTSNIFNNLYSYAKKYSHNKEDRQMEVTTSIKRSSDSVHTINDSKLMFNKRKDEIFKKIFEILDSDQDNQISSFCIDTKKIPSNIINILNPIIVELNDENETLNLNEFVKACEHLFEVK